MENIQKRADKLSAHNFMQLLTALNQYRQMVQEGRVDRTEDVSRLERELKEQILLWGGRSEIESWLEVNDPTSSRPSNIEDFDWSLLE